MLRWAVGATLAVALAGCSGAPAGVPSASSFAVPTAAEPSTIQAMQACSSTSERSEWAACAVPVMEDLLAAAYSPIVESRGLEFVRPTVVMGTAKTACGDLNQVAYCPQDYTLALPLDRLTTIGDNSATTVDWGDETSAYFTDKLTPEEMSTGGAYGALMAMAHEYAHHIQTLIGYERINSDQMASEPDKAATYSSEFELMADCFAGWAAAVTDKNGAYDVTPKDQWAAITALAEIGDDFIQESRGTSKSSDSFNHGAANERANAWVDGAGFALDGKEPYEACLARSISLIDERTGSSASPAAS